MAAYSFDNLAPEYARLWASMRVTRASDADGAARRLAKSVSRYKAVAKVIGCPWEFIAALHNREASGNFAGVLHNGEHIIGTGRKTSLVPAGRGPFDTWEEAAIDALKLKGYDKITDWSIERICYCAESFNGWGYRNKGVPSAYLWAGSNNYVSGKYVADHVWDGSAVDRQLGAMVVYRALMTMHAPALPPDVQAPSKPESVKPTARGAGASTSVIGGIIAALNMPDVKSILICLAIGGAIAAAIWFWPKGK